MNSCVKYFNYECVWGMNIYCYLGILFILTIYQDFLFADLFYFVCNFNLHINLSLGEKKTNTKIIVSVCFGEIQEPVCNMDKKNQTFLIALYKRVTHSLLLLSLNKKNSPLCFPNLRRHSFSLHGLRSIGTKTVHLVFISSMCLTCF